MILNQKSCTILFMKTNKSKLKNIAFIIVIGLFIIPQTRQPIQIWLNKGLAQFSPRTIAPTNRDILTNYNWYLKDNQDHKFNFKTMKGKIVLVNFWATWCPPCIAEMPSLEKLYNAYKDKIEFVFVSNEEKAKIAHFLKEKNYSFKVFQPVSQYPDTFDVSSIPRTFLIDTKGHIVIDKTGAANWNSKTVRQTIDALLEAKD